MKLFRANVEWFVNNGGPALAAAHLHEAMPVTAEVGEFREVDYKAYMEMELADSLLILVATTDNTKEILGYVVGTATPSIHNKGFFEFNTTAFYTVPEHRGAGIGRMLFDGLQQVCAQHGVSEINYVVSEGQPMTHEVVQKLGLVKTETIYTLKVKHEQSS